MATNKKIDLLVVEDDEGLQKQLRWAFSEYNVILAKNRNEAIAAVRRYQPAVITLDLGLPPDVTNVSEGFSTLDEVLTIAPQTKIIVITGNDDRDNAVKAIGMGAYDFYQKPIDPEIIKIIIDRAYKLFLLEEENRTLINKSGNSILEGLLTADEEMLSICRTVEKIAPTDVSVLVNGESGTGKEIIAKALHELSSRKENRFVAINCAAIPENLLESELFGYEKGAFTGAIKQTKGKLELANGGTIFLDEIGDLPLSLQAKLLRFIQERVIERIGGREEIDLDVKVVSATHRNLHAMIENGEFREDLFYRLSEIVINIPPLRERSGDAVLLAQHFLQKYAQQQNIKSRKFSSRALKAIADYRWPGNVRQLENTVKRALIMSENTIIDMNELGIEPANDDSHPINLRDARERAEKQAIVAALNISNRNISRTAELLGVSRPTLYDLMNKYDLK